MCILCHTAHREVVRLRYERYAPCVNEHNIIRVVGVAEVSGQDKSIVKVVNIPLSKPELSIQVGVLPLPMSKMMLNLQLLHISGIRVTNHFG